MAEDIKNLNMAITVDDGSRRVPIQNNRGEEIGAFVFRPTDIGIIRRFNELAGRFDEIVEPLQAAADADEAGVADALERAGSMLDAAVNTLFGSEGAASAFFGRMNPFSPVDGEFYCAKVLSAVGEYIGQAFDAETARFSEKAKTYANRATRRGARKIRE